MKKTSTLIIAIALLVIHPLSAQAHECGDPCEENRIALKEAYAQRVSIQTRAHNAITGQRTRFRHTYNLALRRLTRAQQLANRAFGTQYAQRALNYLQQLTIRTNNFVVTSLAEREALIKKIDRAMLRIETRIATLELERSTLDCDKTSPNDSEDKDKPSDDDDSRTQERQAPTAKGPKVGGSPASVVGPARF